MEPSMGMAVDPIYFNDVSNALEERGIDYGIWNAEDFFFGNAKQVEFTVRTEAELEILVSIIKQITG